MHKFDVKFYKTSGGDIPVIEIIDKLSKKLQAKILRSIELLREYGDDLKEPYSKKIKDGIFELRISQGSDTVRIFYFYFKNNEIILLSAFVKKTQSIPILEMKRAKKYMNDHIANN